MDISVNDVAKLGDLLECAELQWSWLHASLRLVLAPRFLLVVQLHHRPSLNFRWAPRWSRFDPRMMNMTVPMTEHTKDTVSHSTDFTQRGPQLYKSCLEPDTNYSEAESSQPSGVISIGVLLWVLGGAAALPSCWRSRKFLGCRKF